MRDVSHDPARDLPHDFPIGASVNRTEDTLLLQGKGTYVDDLHLPGMLHAAILRSQFAHAEIKSIDVEEALALPGVHAVFTAADLGPVNRPLPISVPHKDLKEERTAYPLAAARVRYVGEPVAIVIADDRYIAEDALERIWVEYDPLPSLSDVSAFGPDSPRVHDDMPDNVAGVIRQKVGDFAKAVKDADHVFELRLRYSRACGQAIETRGIVAQYDPSTDRFHVWCSTQKPHPTRGQIAAMLGVEPETITLKAPHIGGGFGPKGRFYPEYVLVPWAAKRLGRPVKYIEDRHEHLLAALQEREQIHDVQVAVTSEGVILGLRDHFRHDLGAYVETGLVIPAVTSEAIPGPYKIPHYEVEAICIYTHRVPTSPIRGAGRQHAVFVMESVIEEIGRRLGLDPADVRRRNLVRPQEMPFVPGAVGRHGKELIYDSGDYAACLERALQAIEYDAERAHQARLRERGVYRGIGVAMYLDVTGLGPPEGATIRVMTDGRVVVAIGPSSTGQGHKTTMAQICAAKLGVEMSTIEVIGGDTDLITGGAGTFASRTAITAGNAVARAATEVRRRILEGAARIRNVSAADLSLVNGRIWQDGEPTDLTFAEVIQRMPRGSAGSADESAHLICGPDIALTVTRFYEVENPPFAYGAHAVVLEVDPDTGRVEILKYHIVDDCGKMINPMVCKGQIIGGFAQGLGETFYERVKFNEDGQPLVTSLMDYHLPTVREMPHVTLEHLVSPATENELGVKGVGESGAIPVGAAISMAVQDALTPFGVRVREYPIDPHWIWASIQDAAEAKARMAKACMAKAKPGVREALS